MAVEITVPEMGESVLEATVSHWLKKEGEYVNVGDVLVELETDKVNVEVGAKGAGVLQQIKVQEGGDVKVGDVLGMIEEKAEQPKTSTETKSFPEVKPQEAPEKIAEAPQPAQEEKQEAPQREDGRGERQKEVPLATPVASRLARDKDVDIASIRGSGSEGRVTKSDVEQYLQTQTKAEPVAEPPPSLADQQSE